LQVSLAMPDLYQSCAYYWKSFETHINTYTIVNAYAHTNVSDSEVFETWRNFMFLRKPIFQIISLNLLFLEGNIIFRRKKTWWTTFKGVFLNKFLRFFFQRKNIKERTLYSFNMCSPSQEQMLWPNFEILFRRKNKDFLASFFKHRWRIRMARQEMSIST